MIARFINRAFSWLSGTTAGAFTLGFLLIYIVALITYMLWRP